MRRQRKKYVQERRGLLFYLLSWTDPDGRRRQRLIPLPGDEDSAEFDAAYWAIRSGRSEALQLAPRTSWKALIDSYRLSSNYRKLAPGTRRKYDPVIEAMVDKNGAKDVRKVTRAQIRAIHEKYADTPRKADHKLQVLRLLLNYAKNELDWITTNPAEGIKLFGSQREFEPWPDAALTAFENAAIALGETRILTAMKLGTGTGQRAGDLCGMRWDHFDGQYIAVTQDKTKERLWIFCPPFLRDHLQATPKQGAFILAKNVTEGMGYDALERGFRKVRAEAGKVCNGLVMHGWRYTAALALAEAGCSDAEIQAVTGHKTLAMVQKYRRRASNKRLSRQAQERR